MAENAPLAGARALVTGASQGIGQATAEALLARGAQVLLLARNEAALIALAAQFQGAAALPLDLTADDAPARAAGEIERRWGALDVLVHCAGAFHAGAMADSAPDDLDRLYRANLRAPYALTKALLPALIAAPGQIAFVNSSITRAANLAGRGQYAAMEMALKALADSVRDEANEAGVRVLSVYPGTTATPRQEAIHRDQGRPYRPERLLQPGDVARAVCDALAMPRTAEITDLYIRPMIKP